jgi:hypothetical protein
MQKYIYINNTDTNIILIQEEQTALNIFLINFANDLRISALFVFIKLKSVNVFTKSIFKIHFSII